MDRLTLLRPDDWHLHFRDGDVLARTVPDTARVFRRAIVMPNLVPPVCNAADALAYHERILAARPQGSAFEPLMTLYLTDQTSPDIIRAAVACGRVQGAKLYPAGATTHSQFGVTRLENLYPALESMAELGLPLLVHGEITQADVDIFDREKAFIDQQLAPLLQRFPSLKVVFEHITTADAASFVRQASEQVAATITPQHLLYNRNHLLVGGVRPHLYCLPVLKRRNHQTALIEAAISGSPKFFLGTDSAPHAQGQKESACGCAGCYSAPAAIELYAQAFEEAGALQRLEAFASHFGADFYGLPRNTDTITLIREPWTLPEHLSFGTTQVVPLAAGQQLNWRLENHA